MKTDKFYIEYDEIPELQSWNAIAKEFTVYTPVYKVMERRKDKMHFITKDVKEAINTVKELRTK